MAASKASLAQPIAIPKGWRSMRTAPRDGTIILVCETPNGEAWNVVPASYQIHLGEPLMEEFWGVCVTSRVPSHLPLANETAARERGLPVNFKAIAITPLCWQPLPECEPIPKLRRRLSQIVAAKARQRKKIAKSAQLSP